MKVLCIDGVKIGDLGNFFNGGFCIADNEKLINEGEIYTVIDEEIDGYFSLLEKPYYCYYRKKRFIPISNIDEKELIKERELLTEKV